MVIRLGMTQTQTVWVWSVWIWVMSLGLGLGIEFGFEFGFGIGSWLESITYFHIDLAHRSRNRTNQWFKTLVVIYMVAWETVADAVVFRHFFSLYTQSHRSLFHAKQKRTKLLLSRRKSRFLNRQKYISVHLQVTLAYFSSNSYC